MGCITARGPICVDSLAGQAARSTEIVAWLAGKSSCSISTVGKSSVGHCTVGTDWKGSWWIKPEVVCAAQRNKVAWAIVLASYPGRDVAWAECAVVSRVDEVCGIDTSCTDSETCASRADTWTSVAHGISSIKEISTVAYRASEETWSIFLASGTVISAIIASNACAGTGSIVRSVAIQASCSSDISCWVVGLRAVVAVGKKGWAGITHWTWYISVVERCAVEAC